MIKKEEITKKGKKMAVTKSVKCTDKDNSKEEKKEEKNTKIVTAKSNNTQQLKQQKINNKTVKTVDKKDKNDKVNNKENINKTTATMNKNKTTNKAETISIKKKANEQQKNGKNNSVAINKKEVNSCKKNGNQKKEKTQKKTTQSTKINNVKTKKNDVKNKKNNVVNKNSTTNKKNNVNKSNNTASKKNKNSAADSKNKNNANKKDSNSEEQKSAINEKIANKINSANAIDFINVSKSFHRGKKKKNITNNVNALDKLSFCIKKKKITAILGSSGAGKTTTARIMNGLETYDSGQVFINGVLLTKKTQSKIRKCATFVFQNFNLFPHMTVLKNIIYAPIHVYKKNKKTTINKAQKLLKQFDLETKGNLYPHELSGGQKQRVAIIRALMFEPEILIMDEPTASLDPKLTNDVIKTIKTINKNGLTVVVITHDIIVAKETADYVIMMHDGKCVDMLSSSSFFDPRKEKSIYSKKFLQHYID